MTAGWGKKTFLSAGRGKKTFLSAGGGKKAFLSAGRDKKTFLPAVRGKKTFFFSGRGKKTFCLTCRMQILEYILAFVVSLFSPEISTILCRVKSAAIIDSSEARN